VYFVGMGVADRAVAQPAYDTVATTSSGELGRIMAERGAKVAIVLGG
jgi:hypothetical protein